MRGRSREVVQSVELGDAIECVSLEGDTEWTIGQRYIVIEKRRLCLRVTTDVPGLYKWQVGRAFKKKENQNEQENVPTTNDTDSDPSTRGSDVGVGAMKYDFEAMGVVGRQQLITAFDSEKLCLPGKTFRWSRCPQESVDLTTSYWGKVYRNGHTDESRQHIKDMIRQWDIEHGNQLDEHSTVLVGDRVKLTEKASHPSIAEGILLTVVSMELNFASVTYYHHQHGELMDRFSLNNLCKLHPAPEKVTTVDANEDTTEHVGTSEEIRKKTTGDPERKTVSIKGTSMEIPEEKRQHFALKDVPYYPLDKLPHGYALLELSEERKPHWLLQPPIQTYRALRWAAEKSNWLIWAAPIVGLIYGAVMVANGEIELPEFRSPVRW